MMKERFRVKILHFETPAGPVVKNETSNSQLMAYELHFSHVFLLGLII